MQAGGRPLRFKATFELEQAIAAYFDDCHPHVAKRMVETGAKADGDTMFELRNVLHIKVGQKGDMKQIVSAATTPDIQPSVTADCLNSGDELEVQYIVVPFYQIKGATRKARNLESYQDRRAAYITVAVGLFG